MIEWSHYPKSMRPTDLSRAVVKVFESWRRHYNRERPHSALGYLAPEEFAARSSQNQRAG